MAIRYVGDRTPRRLSGHSVGLVGRRRSGRENGRRVSWLIRCCDRSTNDGLRPNFSASINMESDSTDLRQPQICCSVTGQRPGLAAGKALLPIACDQNRQAYVVSHLDGAASCLSLARKAGQVFGRRFGNRAIFVLHSEHLGWRHGSLRFSGESGTLYGETGARLKSAGADFRLGRLLRARSRARRPGSGDRAGRNVDGILLNIDYDLFTQLVEINSG